MKNDRKAAIIREQVETLGDRLPREMVQEELARIERGKSYKRMIRAILIVLAVSAALIIIITNMWLAVLKVNGSSMNPLLKTNEIVLAVRTDRPEKNDVIAFFHNNKLHIKRVIAVAGEKVNIDVYGVVSVNGKKLDEPYVTALSRGDLDIELPFTVPSGSFFVLGANRPASVDSRESGFGVVNRDQILGRVIFLMWPLSRANTVQ